MRNVSKNWTKDGSADRQYQRQENQKNKPNKSFNKNLYITRLIFMVKLQQMNHLKSFSEKDNDSNASA